MGPSSRGHSEISSRRSSPRLTPQQATNNHPNQLHRSWGNAAGVGDLLRGQGHLKAPFSNARAAQRRHMSPHDPALAGREPAQRHLRKEEVDGLRAITKG